MENSQTKNVQEEVSGIMNQYILSQFRSEKEMKTYYLQRLSCKSWGIN